MGVGGEEGRDEDEAVGEGGGDDAEGCEDSGVMKSAG